VSHLPPEYVHEIHNQIYGQLHTKVVGILSTMPEVTTNQSPQELSETLGYILSSDDLQSEINPLFNLCVEYVTKQMGGTG